MFPLSQPALCLDSGGLGVGGWVRYCRAGERKEGAAEGGGERRQTSGEERGREAERETEKLAFQKAIDRLPLKISYWISLTETAF